MTTSWITDQTGRYVALVEAGEEHDTWIQVHGWMDTSEPDANSELQLYIARPADGLRGCIPYAALAGGWAAEGWVAGPPPRPVDTTKDPVTPEPPAEAAKPKTPAAAGGSKSKE